MFGGNCEIRTHGPFRAGSFQDCCNKPDSAKFPKLVLIFLCQEISKPRERSPSCFRVSGAGIWIQVRLVWSGIRESNSCLNLGKVSFYHLTNPAFILTYYLILVVSVGFEPTALLSEDNTLAGCRFQPLIQLTELFFSNVMNTFTVHYTYRHIYDLINVRHINSPIVYQASINIYSFSIHY